jgi:hypothetical protein
MPAARVTRMDCPAYARPIAAVIMTKPPTVETRVTGPHTARTMPDSSHGTATCAVRSPVLERAGGRGAAGGGGAKPQAADGRRRGEGGAGFSGLLLPLSPCSRAALVGVPRGADDRDRSHGVGHLRAVTGGRGAGDAGRHVSDYGTGDAQKRCAAARLPVAPATRIATPPPASCPARRPTVDSSTARTLVALPPPAAVAELSAVPLMRFDTSMGIKAYREKAHMTVGRGLG